MAADHARRVGTTLRTFAVGTPASPDLLAARGVAELLGTEHHERVYTAQEAVDMVQEVVAAIESYEPSLVRSAVPNSLLAGLAARHVKAVLTGEGARRAVRRLLVPAGVDDAALHAGLVRAFEGLHNLNLQRCDRVTMAHGLEARVPFLDLEVLALGLSLPVRVEDRLAGRMEKHLLRRAFEHCPTTSCGGARRSSATAAARPTSSASGWPRPSRTPTWPPPVPGRTGAAGPADTRGAGLSADVSRVPRGRPSRAGAGALRNGLSGSVSPRLASAIGKPRRA